MNTTIVLASGNAGKLREVSQILAGLDLCVVSQSNFAIPEVDETGQSFTENAMIKARHAARHTGQSSIADDSGLEVDALGGAPGIFSARYGGPQASDEQHVRKLLADLTGVPDERRTARFQCAMVYLEHDSDPTPIICNGTWEGRILLEPRGTNGFGYDPVFYVPTHDCSSAELPPELKNALSHRGQALRQLAAALKEFTR